MKTKTQVLQELKLSPSALSAALKSLGIPDGSGFTEEQVERIVDHVTAPTPTPRPAASGQGVGLDLEGVDPARLQAIQNAQLGVYASQAKQGRSEGLIGELVRTAARYEGGVRARELALGLVDPQTEEEKQFLAYHRQLEDALIPILPFGVSQVGGKMVLNLAALKPKPQNPQITGK